MARMHELDGFQLSSGVVAVIAGLIMLVVGVPAIWSLLIIGDGVLVLVALWSVNRRGHRNSARTQRAPHIKEDPCRDASRAPGGGSAKCRRRADTIESPIDTAAGLPTPRRARYVSRS